MSLDDLDMGDVLTEWEQGVTIKNRTRQTVDFVEQDVITGRTQRCVIQVAEKEKLNPDTIDWSLEYLMVHSKDPIEQGEFIEYKARDYKVVNRGPWQDYGFTEVVAEETKRPLLVVNA